MLEDSKGCQWGVWRCGFHADVWVCHSHTAAYAATPGAVLVASFAHPVVGCVGTVLPKSHGDCQVQTAGSFRDHIAQREVPFAALNFNGVNAS